MFVFALKESAFIITVLIDKVLFCLIKSLSIGHDAGHDTREEQNNEHEE